MKQQKLDRFFYQSPIVVFFASIFSGSFYSFYWFYKQWKTVGIYEGKKPRAFIATIFNEVTSFILFKKIWNAAPISVVKNKHLYLVPSIFFVVAVLVSVVISIVCAHNVEFILVFSLCLVVVGSGLFAWVQSIINTTFSKTKKMKKIRLNTPEIIFLVVGFVLFFSNIPILLFLPSADTLLQRTQDFENNTKILNATSRDLYTKYVTCAEKVNSSYETLDTTSQDAVDTYNHSVEKCDKIAAQRDEVNAQILSQANQLFMSIFKK